MLELSILVDIVFARNRLPVLPDFRAWRKDVRPVQLGCKGRLVDVRGDIATDSGVDILKPRATLDKD